MEELIERAKKELEEDLDKKAVGILKELMERKHYYLLQVEVLQKDLLLPRDELLKRYGHRGREGGSA